MQDDTYFFEDIIEIVINNTDINYLAFPLTKFHSVGVKASILFLLQEKIIPNGYIFIGSHIVTGRHIEKSKFDDLKKKAHLTVAYGTPEFNSKEKYIQKLKKYMYHVKPINECKRKVYIACTVPMFELSMAMEKYDIDCIFICLDDGKATYMNPYRLNLYYVNTYGPRRRIMSKYIAMLKILFSAVLALRQRKVFKNNKKLIEFHLFKREQNRLNKGDGYDKYYLEAFNLSKGYCYAESYRRCVLLNTQCFKENNLTDGIVDLELYRKTVDIIKKYNQNVVIKTHPRELDCNKYSDIGGKVLIEHSYTQEEILASLEVNDLPKCIISISSSTLLNLTGIFGIPAISLSKLLLNESVSKEMAKDLKDYIKLYTGAIYFPETYNELEDLIKRYCI